MKIMIVDDDATTLSVVGAVLQSRGHEVIERDTALGTTLAILRQKPEVVLLDVSMPGIAGDKLAALIEQEAPSPPIVILHSSLPARDLEELVRSTGAAGFVPKGAGPMSFLGTFERVVAAAQRGLARKHA